MSLTNTNIGSFGGPAARPSAFADAVASGGLQLSLFRFASSVMDRLRDAISNARVDDTSKCETRISAIHFVPYPSEFITAEGDFTPSALNTYDEDAVAGRKSVIPSGDTLLCKESDSLRTCSQAQYSLPGIGAVAESVSTMVRSATMWFGSSMADVREALLGTKAKPGRVSVAAGGAEARIISDAIGDVMTSDTSNASAAVVEVDCQWRDASKTSVASRAFATLNPEGILDVARKILSELGKLGRREAAVYARITRPAESVVAVGVSLSADPVVVDIQISSKAWAQNVQNVGAKATDASIGLGERYLSAFRNGKIILDPCSHEGNFRAFSPGQLNHVRNIVRSASIEDTGKQIYGDRWRKFAGISDIQVGSLIHRDDGYVMFVKQMGTDPNGDVILSYDAVYGKTLIKNKTLRLKKGTLETRQWLERIASLRDL